MIFLATVSIKLKEDFIINVYFEEKLTENRFTGCSMPTIITEQNISEATQNVSQQLITPIKNIIIIILYFKISLVDDEKITHYY